MLILFISRKHSKIEYTFFPLLLWQLLSWARSGFRFTECSGQEHSSDFKYKSQESICLAAILNLRNARVLFIMAKRHPVRNSQFMTAIREVHSFFHEDCFKTRNNQPVLPHTAIMEGVCACLKVSQLAYEYRSMLKIDSSNFFSSDVFNYVTNWITSPVYLR
jgi:hypothetical protein